MTFFGWSKIGDFFIGYTFFTTFITVKEAYRRCCAPPHIANRLWAYNKYTVCYLEKASLSLAKHKTYIQHTHTHTMTQISSTRMILIWNRNWLEATSAHSQCQSITGSLEMVRVCTMFEIDFDTTLIYGSKKNTNKLRSSNQWGEWRNFGTQEIFSSIWID